LKNVNVATSGVMFATDNVTSPIAVGILNAVNG
jgi:hypothetical protein